eukprot:TRINITY_DN44427_c0_g1_i1.p1 TRINITY_DN44427_c0_g1~~TRINITY_DN44427_c0_g1_i1.p1  ORF type:complete len:137 (+),score=29.16 TRINITY_DN44427_c0_g1_i1:180-590(+)
MSVVAQAVVLTTVGDRVFFKSTSNAPTSTSPDAIASLLAIFAQLSRELDSGAIQQVVLSKDDALSSAGVPNMDEEVVTLMMNSHGHVYGILYRVPPSKISALHHSLLRQFAEFTPDDQEGLEDFVVTNLGPSLLSL